MSRKGHCYSFTRCLHKLLKIQEILLVSEKIYAENLENVILLVSLCSENKK